MPRIYQVIRMSCNGCTNRPFQHIVLMRNRQNRDSTPIEQLGTFDSMPNVFNEKLVSLNIQRINYHLARGVVVSKPVEKLLGLAGLLPVHPMSYITAKRNRNKLQTAAEVQAGDSQVEQDKS